ncbi:hypothetical protein [Streptomyces sp. JV178]|uniref:hypothetical protein n=1 Tax=Streptomyces sp. JV178 TaxID=858632 RepID=UPI001181124E|nr:hypothetical protein [Streptomyces sp. JV178]
MPFWYERGSTGLAEDGEPEGSARQPGRSRPSLVGHPEREAESLGADASGGPDGSGTAGRTGGSGGPGGGRRRGADG